MSSVALWNYIKDRWKMKIEKICKPTNKKGNHSSTFKKIIFVYFTYGRDIYKMNAHWAD